MNKEEEIARVYPVFEKDIVFEDGVLKMKADGRRIVLGEDRYGQFIPFDSESDAYKRLAERIGHDRGNYCI